MTLTQTYRLHPHQSFIYVYDVRNLFFFFVVSNQSVVVGDFDKGHGIKREYPLSRRDQRNGPILLLANNCKMSKNHNT